MRPNEIEDEEEEFRGPSKSHLKRVQLDLQSLGRDMTRMGDETLAKIGLPEDVLVEIIEFGAQRRQLQLIGKKMRDMDPDAVREAIARATGESRAAVALLHRCETLRDRMIESDDVVCSFIDEHSDIDIRRLRELVRFARRERDQAKPPKSARELYRLLHDYLDEPLDLMAKDEEASEEAETPNS